jgi:hypothetical protein
VSAARLLTGTEQNHVRAAPRFFRVRVRVETFEKVIHAHRRPIQMTIDGVTS